MSAETEKYIAGCVESGFLHIDEELVPKGAVMKEVIFEGRRWQIDDQLAPDFRRWLEWAEKHRIEETTEGGARGAHSSSQAGVVRNHAPEQLELEMS